MTPAQAIQLHQRFLQILKQRFPNLTTTEAGQMAGDLVLAANEILQAEPVKP